MAAPIVDQLRESLSGEVIAPEIPVMTPPGRSSIR